MGGSGKGKHMKGKGKSKFKKSDYANRQPETSNSDLDVGQRKTDKQDEFYKPRSNDPYPDVNSYTGTSARRNETEDELKQLLSNKADLIYDEALRELLDLGYEIDVARKAILMNGHGLGKLNILSNIVNNSISYINSGCVTEKLPHDEFNEKSERVTSLVMTLVKMLRELAPNLSRYDALKDLLVMNWYPEFMQRENRDDSGKSADDYSGDESCSQDLLFPKRFHLTPALRSLLQQNVKTIADIFRPESEASPTYTEALHHLSARKEPDLEDSNLLRLVGSSEESSLEDWLEREPVDPKNEIIQSLVKECRALEDQVKERNEWAQEKVIQAEEKLGHHIWELSMLRMEKFQTEQLKIEKEVLQQKNMMRLWEIENALGVAQTQVNQASTAVEGIENYNSVIRADTEAYVLSASESNRTLREVEKRERKYLKRVAAIETERNQLHELIEVEKKKVGQLNEELRQLNKAEEDAEAKWREQLKEKELAHALVTEEEMLKKSAEANLRSKQASVNREGEMNYQCLSDELHRLEDQLCNLHMSDNNTFEVAPPESYVLRDCSGEGLFCGRECVVCSRNEASVLFLPCAHQVVCSKCNEEKMVGATCPCCHVQIDKRVNVYGTS